MNSTITPNLRKLLAIGALLFLVLKNIGYTLSTILEDLFSMMGSSFWVAFFSSELIPVVLILVIAYYTSNKIWHRVSTGIEKVNSLMIKLILILIGIWILNYFYPFLIREIFFKGTSPYYGSSTSSQMVYFSILRTIFNYLEVILLVIVIAVRKEKMDFSLDENLDSM